MKTLILVRHAKSSWDNAAQSDFDRPLNNRGRNDAPEMAERLRTKVPHLDAIVSSPALRAKSTAAIFAENYGNAVGTIVYENGLYLAGPAAFAQLVDRLNDAWDTVAIFAHNPGITEFANSLTDTIKTDNIPTCGIFAVSCNIGRWQDFSHAKKELLFYDYPKLGS